MGAWDFGVLDADVASDVRGFYLRLLKSGKTSADAKRTVIREMQDEFADLEVGPTAWLSLALAQWEVGRLDHPTSKKSLQMIDSGAVLRPWEDEPKQLAKHTLNLQKLRTKLLSPQPEEKVFRPQKLPSFTTWKPGEYFRFQLRKGLYALLRLTDVRKNSLAFAIVDWHGAEVPPQKEVEKLPVGSGADFVAVTRSDKELPSDRLVRLGFGKKIPTDGLGVYYRWTKVPHHIKRHLKLR